MSADQEEITGRRRACARAARTASSCASRRSDAVAAPIPAHWASSVSGAPIISARPPKRAISALARGLTSPRGRVRKR